MTSHTSVVINMISVVLELEQRKDIRCEHLIHELKSLIKEHDQEHTSLIEIKFLSRRTITTLLAAERYLDSVKVKEATTNVNFITRVHQWVMGLLLISVVSN